MKKKGELTNKKKAAPNIGLLLRGRYFSARDLKTISRCVDKYFKDGRTRISLAICEKLKWRQPNGWPKDRACRDVLLQLEKNGMIKLPAPRIKRKPIKLKKRVSKRCVSNYDLVSPIEELTEPITLELAKGNKSEIVWNDIIREYHYLGHKVIVGRCIKYLIRAGEKLLGALAFSSPAWHLAPRDNLLKSLNLDKADIRDRVINNSRFLILPNVKIPNLASRVLSIGTKRILVDWGDYYSITPIIVETFVQPSLYVGTIYKASNWLEVGSTKGYAKTGSTHHNSQEAKKIFLYGLSRHARRRLLKAYSEAQQENSP